MKVTTGTIFTIELANVADTIANAVKKRFWNKLPLCIINKHVLVFQ